MPTQEAINDLAMKAQNSDPETMLQVWQGVSRLAYKIALRYLPATNAAVDMDDLRQSAFLGVCEAVRTYDPIKGAAFSTWAIYYVRNACRRALGLDDPNRATVVSLDEPIPGMDDDLTLLDTIPVDDHSFDRSELHRDIEAALKRLPDDMARVIYLHDLGGQTIGEAAAAMQCERDTAAKWRHAGLKKLRRDRGLQSYRDPIRLRYKGVRAFKSDWMSVVEEEVIRRLDRP